jgi:N-methylhydantoinase A
VATPVYDRYGITTGDRVVGPAILEEIESTVVVQPGYEAVADRFGNTLLRPSDPV